MGLQMWKQTKSIEVQKEIILIKLCSQII